MFQNTCSATSATTGIPSFAGNTSASTDVPFAEFWATVSTTVISWNFAWQLPEYETIELPAHEKTVHGRVKGKLKMPKPQYPRGYKHLRLRNEFSGPHFR